MRFAGRPLLAGSLPLLLAIQGGCHHARTRALDSQRVDQVIQVDTREGTRLAFDISPDRSTIIIDLLGQLWTLPAGGGTAKPITSAVRDTAVDLSPSFSPDGRHIVFQGERGRATGVWRVRSDGAALERLTDSAASAATAPSWSPDGQSIVFVLRDTLRILDVGSRSLRAVSTDSLPRPGQIRAPAWSRDGARIAFAHSNGRLYEVPTAGGVAKAITPPALRASAPSLAPDGTLAFFAREPSGRQALWLMPVGDTARRLVGSGDITNLSARWLSPDTVVYSADGRLWKRALSGQSPVEIPFTARVVVQRWNPPVRPVVFPDPGSAQRARGFMGLALSPDGGRIAMLALGKLWMIGVHDARATAVADIPSQAHGLAWSPDGRSVLWGAGPGGSEDLFITDVERGATRRFTALTGREERASWSPDGRWIAFVHVPKPTCDTPPYQYDDECGQARVRVARVGDSAVTRLSDTRAVSAPLATGTWFSFFPAGQEEPRWTANSDGIHYLNVSRVMFAPLEGTPRQVGVVPAGATFVHVQDSAAIFVRNNALWSARLADGSAHAIADDPAMYLTASPRGSLLYLSSDGLRVRDAAGAVRLIGWPVFFSANPPPTPLLLRNARIVDGTGAPPRPADILLRDGRIARIAAAGSLPPPADARIVDAGGRTVIPGLIDLHQHLWDDAVVPAALFHGITTVREMGGNAARAAGFRDAIAAGVLPGPRMVLGGFQFNPGGSGTSAVVVQAPTDSAGAARGLAILQALGGAYVKMRLYSSHAQAVSFVRAARAAGLNVSGHCAHTLPLIAAGISAKEHLGSACGDRSDGDWYDDLAGVYRAADLPVVVTTAAFAAVPRIMSDTSLVSTSSSFVTPFLRWWALRLAPGAAATYAQLAEVSRSAAVSVRARGVRVLPASDNPSLPDALYYELEEMVAAGFSPLEAVVSATGGAAKALAADASIGTIELGKLADLVILDADPTADIRNIRRVSDVIQGGRIVDRDALRSRVGPARDPR